MGRRRLHRPASGQAVHAVPPGPDHRRRDAGDQPGAHPVPALPAGRPGGGGHRPVPGLSGVPLGGGVPSTVHRAVHQALCLQLRGPSGGAGEDHGADAGQARPPQRPGLAGGADAGAGDPVPAVAGG